MEKQLTQKVGSAVVAKAIEKKASPLLKLLKSTELVDEKSYEKVGTALRALKTIAKEAGTQEKTITDPLTQAMNAARAHFKPFKDMVKEMEINVKAGMLAYVTTQNKKAATLAENFERGEGRITKLETLDRAIKQTVVTPTSTKLAKVWTLRVVDEKKIPRQYLVPDEQAIKEDLKAGKKVAGCVWEQVDQIRV